MEKQFLLVVRNERGFAKFQLMAVANNYDTLNDTNFGSIGGGDSLNLSLTEPNNSTFTLTAMEP